MEEPEDLNKLNKKEANPIDHSRTPSLMKSSFGSLIFLSRGTERYVPRDLSFFLLGGIGQGPFLVTVLVFGGRCRMEEPEDLKKFKRKKKKPNGKLPVDKERLSKRMSLFRWIGRHYLD